MVAIGEPWIAWELGDDHMVTMGDPWIAWELRMAIWWPWVIRGLHGSWRMTIWWP